MEKQNSNQSNQATKPLTEVGPTTETQDSGALALHLRTVYFTLLMVSFGMIVAVNLDPTSDSMRAIDQLDSIVRLEKEFIKLYEKKGGNWNWFFEYSSEVVLGERNEQAQREIPSVSRMPTFSGSFVLKIKKINGEEHDFSAGYAVPKGLLPDPNSLRVFEKDIPNLTVRSENPNTSFSLVQFRRHRCQAYTVDRYVSMM